MTTGSVLAQFTITISQAVSEQVAVEWHTADGTAMAGVDYAAAKGIVLFAPGQTAKTVDILVHGRAVGAEDRSFFVEMLPPTNAILGASIGECIIHVDTTGSTPVTQIIVPTGPKGLQGDSAYQAWLDLGNTGTEEDFINSLKPSAEEIAEEVAPILNVSNSPLTAEGTETLSKPDTMTGKRLARRVAYVGAAKVATVVLADGDNLITHAALSGDAVDFNSISLYPRILRGTVVISPEWNVEPGDKILIKSAVAGDVLHVCQYDVISERAVRNAVEPLVAPVGSQAFEALRRSYAEAGHNLVDGSFETGGTVTDATDVLLWEATGVAYAYSATLPHTIGGVEIPIGNPLWVTKGVDIFRGQVAEPSGSSKVGFQQAGAGSEARTAQDKLRERITPPDFGAIGDGVTDDQSAFDALESSFSGQVVDLMGRTYLVTAIPVGNRYANGYFKVGSSTFKAVFDTAPKFGSGRVVSCEGALASLPDDYNIGGEGLLIAIGAGAMGSMKQAKKAIAIGPGSQSEGTITRENISIGEDSLRFVQALTPDYDQNQKQGTRNNSVGGNSLRFLRHGINCNAFGRNAASCLVDSIESTVFGANAVGGFAPIGLSGDIENWSPNSGPDAVTAFGSNVLNRTITGYNTAGGHKAASNLVQGRGNVVWGQDAMRYAEANLGLNGGIKTDKNINGTYSQAGTTLTLAIASHGVLVGEIVGIRLLDGLAKTFQYDVAPAYVASVPNANTIVITSPRSFTTSGNAILFWSLSSPSALKAERNTVVGAQAAREMRIGSNNSIGGYQAMSDATSETSGEVDDNAAWGFRALTGWTKPKKMTAVGTDALRFMQDGTVATGPGFNCTGLGHSSRVSGNGQVQLGDSATTTYVFGTVQNRSDARDKVDVRDTVLGIDFIMGLRPVDGRWDMRDDYWEEYDEKVGVDAEGRPVFETKLRKLPKDGSKARKRKHHWFIAQEVKELCDSLGVEFGGYQDHSVNGGCDVLTLGYDEFIPPTVKAVQQCWTRLDELEKRIAALE